MRWSQLHDEHQESLRRHVPLITVPKFPEPSSPSSRNSWLRSTVELLSSSGSAYGLSYTCVSIGMASGGGAASCEILLHENNLSMRRLTRADVIPGWSRGSGGRPIIPEDTV
ncbi:hypothetical protein EYF80_059435 [Liparis tanakae]|uniref:Uncharacterized protein n=1 Tax=Liparis tanakae TaxID=230148 RepID=A0A4Z2EQ23_9TELE|nr:hypothetical protein EYF80_059435 [Liparis tanakae]